MLLPPFPFPEQWPSVAARGGVAYGARWMVPEVDSSRHVYDGSGATDVDASADVLQPRQVFNQEDEQSELLDGEGNIVVTEEWREVLARAAKKRAIRQQQKQQNDGEVADDTPANCSSEPLDEAMELFVGDVLFASPYSSKHSTKQNTKQRCSDDEKGFKSNSRKSNNNNKRASSNDGVKKKKKKSSKGGEDPYRRFQERTYGSKRALEFATLEALLDAKFHQACGDLAGFSG